MSTASKDLILSVMRASGTADALDLRRRAADMDGTAIIAEEQKVPAWCADRDYTGWPVGAPVSHDGNVFGLLQPHNAAHYTGTPATLAALWSPKHTKDPKKAKPYLTPNGTSGLYMVNECCLFDGAVFSSNKDNNPYSPADYPAWWDRVTAAE